MHDRSDRFADRLLTLDHAQATPPLRERHAQAVAALLERRLGAAERLKYVALALAGLVGGGVCAALALTEPEGLPPLTRAALTLCAGFGMAWCVLATAVLRRGALDHRRHGGAAARMAFGFTLTTLLLFSAMAVASPGPTGLVMLMVALGLLIAAAVVLLSHSIEQAELRGRAHLLTVELRLAELGQALRQPPT